MALGMYQTAVAAEKKWPNEWAKDWAKFLVRQVVAWNEEDGGEW